MQDSTGIPVNFQPALAHTPMFVVRQAVGLYNVFIEQDEPAESFFRNFIAAPMNIKQTVYPELSGLHSTGSLGATIYLAYRAALGLEI